jgi:hypothetical protein
MEMKTYSKTIFVTTLFILLGCGLENSLKHATAITDYFGKSEVKVGTSFYKSTNGKDIDAYTIDMKNVQLIDDGQLTPEIAASKSALILYDNLNSEERKEKNSIDVTIESAEQKTEFKYPMKDIKRLTPFIEKSKKFISMLKEGNYEGMYSYLDHKTISKELFYKDFVDKLAQKNESIITKINAINVLGFKIEKKLERVEIYCNTKVDTLNILHQFVFEDRRNNPKMVGFWIN